MIYVDSNYWIYWLDSRLPEHKYVKGAMRRALDEGILLSNASLIEVAHYLRRLPREEFREIIDSLQNLSTLTLVDLDEEVTLQAIRLIPEYASKGLGGRDCVVIASIMMHGVKRILTHDRAFKQVKDLEVLDSIPFGVK